VAGNGEAIDFVVVDFADPSNFALGKRYSTAFYRLLEKRLSAKGRIVVQATSPLYARKSFWSLVATLEAAGFKAAPTTRLGEPLVPAAADDPAEWPGFAARSPASRARRADFAVP
jgi:predicted membrane-bound spermidine synthase